MDFICEKRFLNKTDARLSFVVGRAKFPFLRSLQSERSSVIFRSLSRITFTNSDSDSRPMPALAETMTTARDEQETFTSRLAHHAGIIRKVAFSYAQTYADRQDLAQEITLQLWRAYPRYASDRPFSTWMYRIALNVAISSLRRRTPSQPTDGAARRTTEIAEEESGDAATDERVVLLQKVIAALPPLDRGLMLLYLDDHSYREIGEVLGLSETNVATKLQRLKQRVREEMLQLTKTDL